MMTDPPIVKRNSPWKIIGWSLVAIVVLAGGILGYYVRAIYHEATTSSGAHNQTTVSPTEVIKTFVHINPPGRLVFKDDQKSFNILVMGIDYNWSDETPGVHVHLPYSKGARSDTMFVLNVRADAARLGMLTIPRDMYVDIANGKGQDKINGAYSVGGVPLAMATVEKFLNIKCDHYMVLRVIGTIKLVDALGGLDLDVEKNMDYDDNWGMLHVHLKKGMQHLDGQNAVGYARFRHDEEGDRGRIRRQHQVVDTVIAKLKTPEVYANPQKVLELAKLFRKYVETDLQAVKLADLASVYQHFDRKNLRTGHLEGDDTYIGDMSIIAAPPVEARTKLVNSILYGQNQYKPKDIRVEVLNTTDTKGAASALGDQLHKQGYTVVRVDDFKGKPSQTTVLTHGDDQDVLDYGPKILPDARVMVDRDFKEVNIGPPPGDVDITVILGPDWKPPAAHPGPVSQSH